MEVGGDGTAVRRYAHLAPAQMARNAAVIDTLLHDTITSQRRLRTNKKGTMEDRNPLIQQ